MTTGSFARVYQQIVGKALAPHGFQPLNSNFWRIRDKVLQSIVLDKGDSCTFAGGFGVQPIVYPLPGFIIDFGGSVDEMLPGHGSKWVIPRERKDIEDVVGDYAHALVRHVVPWLDRFQTCRDLVETDLKKQWGIWLPNTPTKSQNAAVLGLCALATEMPNAAREYLEFAQQEYRKFLRPESPPWYREDLQLVEDFLALLAHEDWEGIRAKLAAGEAFTRQKIGLPPS